MPVLRDIATLATCRDQGAQGDVHTIEHAAVVWRDAEILWVGREADLPGNYDGEPSLSAGGKLVIPGLIDCHTHLAFAGERTSELVRRIRGESYLDIARAGGGIAVTVEHTRNASPGALLSHAHTALRDMAAQGVTTVEAKSGYGLDLANELKLLEVYAELNTIQPLEIVSTVLAAHVVPKEHAHDRDGYVKLVIERILPEVAARKLATFCDVFLEQSAFTEAEAEQILRAAQRLGLGAKLHADQLSHSGGGRLSAALHAVSADHLEHTSDEDLERMAEASVVGVTLPSASLYTFEPPLDARRLVARGVKVAVATDFNPGSAPSHNLRLSLLLACTLNRLTPREALKGSTTYAARAVGRSDALGSIEASKQADLAVIDAPSIDQWVTALRPDLAVATIKRGQIIHGALGRPA